MKTKHLCSVLLIQSIFSLQADTHEQLPVLILSPHYNRTDFIEWQHRTFKKFLKDPYEYAVFNDATDPAISRAINATCTKLGVRCFDIPQTLHRFRCGPSVRNADAIRYALEKRGFDHDGIVLLIDSDMFLIRPFSVNEYLNNYDLAGLKQTRSDGQLTINYLWIGLVFMNVRSLPNKKTLNFDCGCINGINVDTGGCSYYYLQKNPRVRKKFVNQCYHPVVGVNAAKMGFSSVEAKFLAGIPPYVAGTPPYVEFLADKCFMHYRCGTNWDNRSSRYHADKTKIFKDFLNQICY